MIQFNLLPDVKLEFIKTRRTKHLVTLACSGVIVVSIVILIGMFSVVNVLQHKRLNDLNDHIAKDTQTLKATPDLDKVLTIQNQLSSLTSLHEQTPSTSRLFDYMSQLTPTPVTVSDVKIDFTANTISITGNADSLTSVNQYVDTLKFTTYTATDKSGTTTGKAFSNTVLTTFSVDDKNTSYQIDTAFAPIIFDNTKTVTLVTPHIISTRSETEKPTDLFQKVGGQ